MQFNQSIIPKGSNRDVESRFTHIVPKQQDSKCRCKSEHFPEPLKYCSRFF